MMGVIGGGTGQINAHAAALALTVTIKHEIGVDVSTEDVLKLFKLHWPELSYYAHIIHRENERDRRETRPAGFGGVGS